MHAKLIFNNILHYMEAGRYAMEYIPLFWAYILFFCAKVE